MTDTKKPDTCPSCGFVERNGRPKLAAKLGLHWHTDWQSNDAFYECSDPFHDSALPPTTPNLIPHALRGGMLDRIEEDFAVADSDKQWIGGGGSTGADTINGRTQKIPGVPEEVITIARELYDRFVMGGWEPQDAYPFLKEIIGESKERMGMETISKLRAELKQVRAATRVETAPDDIEKLVRDWYYAPGKIVGPDNLAAFVREIVAAQAAEIERLRRKNSDLITAMENLNECAFANYRRAEAAEALVEKMRTGLTRITRIPLEMAYTDTLITSMVVTAEALLDRSRKGNGA